MSKPSRQVDVRRVLCKAAHVRPNSARGHRDVNPRFAGMDRFSLPDPSAEPRIWQRSTTQRHSRGSAANTRTRELGGIGVPWHNKLSEFVPPNSTQRRGCERPQKRSGCSPRKKNLPGTIPTPQHMCPHSSTRSPATTSTSVQLDA